MISKLSFKFVIALLNSDQEVILRGDFERCGQRDLTEPKVSPKWAEAYSTSRNGDNDDGEGYEE